MNDAAPIALALLAGAANLIGAAAVTARPRWSPRTLDAFVAFAAGFMVCVALADALPEALARGGPGAPLVATAGFLLVHLTQHTLAPHFHFGEETHDVNAVVSVSALAGLMLHTLVDGVAIASGFAVERGLGLLLAAAVSLHKLPEGVAIASIFLAAGASRARALGAAAVLGLTTVLGAVVAEGVGLAGGAGLALAAGVTLYVAAANLVPEVQHRRGWLSGASFFAGCAAYFGARALAGGHA
jgi:ZIP family zinc transporter/zinc and cadmium transporter